MGCNFVIAVSVTARLEKRFGDLTPGRAGRRRKKPGVVPTIFRSLQVQNHNLNAYGVRPADVVISPDVTGHRPRGVHAGEGNRRDRRGGHA